MRWSLVLVDEGKIKRIGVSNFDVPLLQESLSLCKTPLATNQVHYNMFYRQPQKNGALKFCQENGISVTAYSPIKDGVLDNAIVNEIANRHGCTPAQVAIQWLIRQPNVITIPKSSNQARQQENLDATDIQLGEEDVQQLNNLKNGD